MNPRAALQERYPTADFWEYFRFLGECKGTHPEGRTHEHHICPRKQFPEFVDAPENLITLSIDDHAHAHDLLGDAVPELQKSVHLLASWSFEAAAKAGRKGGPIAAQVCKKLGIGVYAPESPGKIGGKIGGRKNVESGHIARLNSNHEHQVRAGRAGSLRGTHKRWHVARRIKSPTCSLCGAL